VGSRSEVVREVRKEGADTVAYACNPSYMEGRVRRIVVWD
jgi:hypothetical protein